MPDDVAVLIPAKDAVATVARAVRSALAQREAGEVLVVVDGSRDSTAEAALACDDGSGRLKVLRQANRGPSAAINAAHDATSSPLVCVLDADDFFQPGRLAEAGRDWELAADRLLIAEEGAEDGPYEAWGGIVPENGLLGFADFHLTLDAKAAGRLPDALPTLMRNLDAVGYAVAETLRARRRSILLEGQPRTGLS